MLNRDTPTRRPIALQVQATPRPSLAQLLPASCPQPLPVQFPEFPGPSILWEIPPEFTSPFMPYFHPTLLCPSLNSGSS